MKEREYVLVTNKTLLATMQEQADSLLPVDHVMSKDSLKKLKQRIRALLDNHFREMAPDVTMETVQTCLVSCEGRVPLHRAAEAVVQASGDSAQSVDTVKRQLRKSLSEPRLFNGWVIWYAEDYQPATTYHGATKYWIFGIAQEDAS